MKFFVLLLFLINSDFGYSQFYLGGNVSQNLVLLKEDNSVSQIKTRSDSERNIYMTWQNEKIGITNILYFDSNGLSNLYCVLPDDNQGYNYMVRGMNEKYIVVNENEWRYYANGKTFKISTLYVKDMGRYAIYYSQEHVK